MANEQNENIISIESEDVNEEENFVMLSDVLKEEEELEQQTIAVYGASDEKYCSYDNVSYEKVFYMTIFLKK